MKMKCLTLALLAIVGMGSAHASVIEIGDGAWAGGVQGNIAIGDDADCVPSFEIYSCTAIGRNADVVAGGVAMGDGAIADSSGIPNNVDGYKSTAIGINAHAQSGALAVGQNAFATNFVNTDGHTSVALGTSARATNGSVSIGSFSNNDGRTNVVSVGNSQATTSHDGWFDIAPTYRQIINVGAGTQPHDAVIVQQVIPAVAGITSSLGGGASYNATTGAYTGPSYGLSMGTYNTVEEALLALDNKLGGGSGDEPFFAAQGTGIAGEEALASAINSTASGAAANASNYGATANGAGANASGEASTAVGHQANADANEGTAVGAYARASEHCSAVGYAAECDEYGTTSFGRDGDNSRLTHVADGQADTDAANMGQVRAVDSRVTQTQTVVASQASWFGGGANYDPVTGVFNGPNYAFISGANYNNVGDALADLDQRVYDLEQQPPGSGPAGPQGADGRSAYEVAVDNGFPGTEQEWLASLKGDKGPEGPQGPAGQDGAGNGSTAVAGRNIEVQDNEDGSQTVSVTDQVKLSDQGSVEVGATRVDGNGVSIQGGPSMTRNGVDAGNRRVTNVADGRIEQGSQDAVNGGQIWALQQDWNDRWTEINHRVDGLEDQIDAVGAQASAMANMSGSGSYLPVGKVAINGGYGQYGSSKAFAVGAKVRFSERTSGTLGISASDDGKLMIGAGFSVTLP